MTENIEKIKSKIIEYGYKAVVGAILPISYVLLGGRNPNSYAWSLMTLTCSEIIYREYRKEKGKLETLL